MQLHIRDASKIHRSGEQAPVAILATHLIDDISDMCVRMAIINHHELWPARPPIGAKTETSGKRVDAADVCRRRPAAGTGMRA